MTIVSSSFIAAIGYENGIITVEFKSGETYDYPGTEELYKQFLAAPSKGRFFRSHIK